MSNGLPGGPEKERPCWGSTWRAGLGRTGSVLAAYFVAQGSTAEAAITRVRDLRPGSVETVSQEEAIELFAHRRAAPPDRPPP